MALPCSDRSGGSTGGDGAQSEEGSNDINNPGDASIGGPFDNRLTTGGQQYLRNNKASEFDLVNDEKPNNANSTVANFVGLQNKKFANIVVGRDAPQRDVPAARYYIGTAEEKTEVTDSLQSINKDNSDVDAGIADGNNKNNGLVSVSSQKIPGSFKATNIEMGVEEEQNTSSRIFGAYYRPGDNNPGNNSHWLPIVNAKGEDKKLVAADQNALLALPQQIKLNNMQYGRVTANLDPLTDDEKKNVVEDYFQINSTPNRIVGRADDKAVSQYFYRGINRTVTLPKGTIQYAGQALMYGIDNSYHGAGGADPKSNAIGLPDNGGEGIGNFVHATVDMDQGNVVGQVYNVWLRNDGNKTEPDTLVTFNGKIAEGSNTVAGTAKLAYEPKAGISKDADFQGSFYGKNAEEMGGAFNSVKEKVDGVGTFGKAGWGGVFGAKKIEDTTAPIINPENNGNHTESGSD